MFDRRRLPAFPEEPVPVLGARDGPRVMMVTAVAAGLMGLVFLALSVASPGLGSAVGLGDTEVATVIKASKTYPSEPTRCDTRYTFVLTWGDRQGNYTFCNRPGDPLTHLAEGDQLAIITVPWTSEVDLDRTSSRVLGLAGGLAALLFLWIAVSWTASHHRLLRGTATGARMEGVITRVGRNSIRVDLSGAEAGHGLVLLLSKARVALAAGDRVDVWATRRALVTGRPRGPWVLTDRGQASLYSHGWWRKPLEEIS